MNIEKFTEQIKKGGLVAFPTETVYGLGANALDPDACKKIFEVKGRPANNPLIVHVSDLNQLETLVAEIPPISQKLIDAFWPGPLTLIFKRSVLVPDIVTAGLDTVAIRMPSHKITQKLIKNAGVPIAAPSANTSGKPSPTHHQHVIDDLGNYIDTSDVSLIEGGWCDIGIESTVINPLTSPPTILRYGGMIKEQIEDEIGMVQDFNDNKDDNVRSPGRLHKHYSPNSKVILVPINSDPNDFIKFDSNKKIGIAGTESFLNQIQNDEIIKIEMGNNLEEVTKNVFSTLWIADKLELDKLYIQSFEEKGLGKAIMERIERAAE